MQDLRGTIKKFEFYSKCHGKPRKGFSQGGNIWLFEKNQIKCE